MFIRQREQKRHKSSNDCLKSCGSDSLNIHAVHEDMTNDVSTCGTNEWDNEDYSGNAWNSQMNVVQQGSIHHPYNATENVSQVRDKYNNDKNTGINRTSQEDYFDSLLGMIEESVKDLNV